MAKFKKVDDLIGAFLDFDLLDDEMPVATLDDEGNSVIMTRAEYEEYLRAKQEKESAQEDAENPKDGE